MAKIFAGFTPEQMGKIIPEMQGMQGDEQAKFLAANPAAASRVGKMAELAQKRIGMAYGGYMKRDNYNLGGVASSLVSGVSNNPTYDGQPLVGPPVNLTPLPIATDGVDLRPSDIIYGTTASATQTPQNTQTGLDAAQKAYADANKALQDAMAASQADPENEALATAVTDAQTRVNAAQAAVQTASAAFTATELPTGNEALAGIIKDPSSSVTKADVAKTTAEQAAAGMIDPATGQLTTPAPTVTATTAETVAPVEAPEVKPAATYEPLPASAGVEDVMSRLEAATGKPSAEAIADAATMDPQQLAQLGLSVAQIKQAQQVAAVPDRTVQAGELVSGSAVDQGQVQQVFGDQPLEAASVQTEMASLMSDFDAKQPPAWAAGAMRAAAAQMEARGLSGSSLAGQALIQAAMESALPIAQMDAQNKQQVAIESARQRAEFLKLDFNQEFQTRVTNAAKISEIANMNFTADQQVALENARLAQSVDLANLSAVNAKVMADAAAMSQMDLANLNNRQQSQVQNAKSFLQMDMQNLSNAQQTSIFKSQQLTNALLSDAAAANAAKQFNASSENQTNQFFANLSASVAQFNNEQANAMNRFNAGEANTVAQFNATQITAREQFNAQNSLIIAQANAQWAQAITTADNAAQNQANRDAAMASNELTMTAYNSIIQRERDALSYAFKAAESTADREVQLLVASMQAEIDKAKIQADIDAARGQGIGSILAAVAPTAFKWALGIA